MAQAIHACPFFSIVFFVLVIEVFPSGFTFNSRSAKDLFMATVSILGATAKGAAGVGKGLATFATDAQSAPAEV